jgi:2-dehydro-3-deoxygluconokinase
VELTGKGVITLGETMALLTPPAAARLRDGAGMTLGIGGAESNVAIALARLGCASTWISRVGEDDFGTLVAREVRAEGVRVLAERDPDRPTGLMVKEARGGRTTRVRYYRAGSAASGLSAAEVERYAEQIAAAAVLHVTGITAALGPGPREAVLRAVEIASAHHTFVSFDVNHRSALWTDEEAGPVLADLARRAHLTFAGPEEAALILGFGAAGPGRPRQGDGVRAGEPGRPREGDGVGAGEADRVATLEEGEKLARELAAVAAGDIVLKLGSLGAVVIEGEAAHHGPTEPIVVTDPVGAGDAFVGGYLAALLDGESPLGCLTLANRIGGAVCRAPGDWEGLPTRAELEAVVSSEVAR